MKNTNKAFTLVELIVVITILAILGTIAFISLPGYSQDAKNAKVLQDLNTLSSAVEIALTDGTLSGISSLVEGTGTLTNVVNSGSTITIFTKNPTDSSTGTLSTSNYKVGNVDFAALRQNGDDFQDPEKKAYIAAYAYSGSTSYYQLVGQKKETSGEYTAIVKGNYVAQNNGTDVAGLIETKNDANTGTGITNNENLGSNLDNLLY